MNPENNISEKTSSQEKEVNRRDYLLVLGLVFLTVLAGGSGFLAGAYFRPDISGLIGRSEPIPGYSVESFMVNAMGYRFNNVGSLWTSEFVPDNRETRLDVSWIINSSNQTVGLQFEIPKKTLSGMDRVFLSVQEANSESVEDVMFIDEVVSYNKYYDQLRGYNNNERTISLFILDSYSLNELRKYDFTPENSNVFLGSFEEVDGKLGSYHARVTVIDSEFRIHEGMLLNRASEIFELNGFFTR